VYRSGRNLQNVHLMRYREATAFEVLWADALLIEEAAVGGQHVAGSETKARSVRAKRAKKAAEPSQKRAAAKKKTTARKAISKAASQAAKKTAKKTAKKARKGGGDA
jgi:hypothetical protein